MSDSELISYIKKVETNFRSHIEKGTIEVSLEYYNLCEELMARGINAIQENKKLKDQLEKSEKARKEAIEYINKHAYFDEEMTSINALGIENTKKVLDILDIDKGEMKDE